MEVYDISYFRKLWQANMTDLQNQCDVWEKICKNSSVPEEVHGDIRTNIGLAKLLMNQKLKQFKGLIDDSEFNTGEKEINSLDLQGFWDMVYNEVEKIKKCFMKLEKCKNNEWQVEDEDSEMLLKRKVPVKKEITVFTKKDDSSKSHALAARQRLAEAKRKMLAMREQQKQQHFVEIVESNNYGLNCTQDQNSEDGKKIINTESSHTAIIKESNKNLKDVNREKISSSKTNDADGTVGLNEVKCKATNLHKNITSSIKNKENFVLEDDASNIKYKSKMKTKSKEKNEVLSAKKGKSKDFGKLQCVTRSAKKALLAQQNLL